MCERSSVVPSPPFPTRLHLLFTPSLTPSLHLILLLPSFQAFEGLKTAGRKVRRPDCTLVTVDHNVPTTDRSNFTTVQAFIQEADSRTQVRRRRRRRSVCKGPLQLAN